MTIKTRPVRFSLLSLLSAPLAGAKINAQLSQSTPDGVIFPSHEIDGYDIVPLVVSLLEDPEKPGDYLGQFWPNTRGLKGTCWLVNVAAGELLLKTLNLTVVDGSAAVEVPLKVMVDAPPYAQVLPSSKVVGVAQGYADAAGHFASLAIAAAQDVIALGLDAGDVAAAVEYAHAAEAARDAAVTAASEAAMSSTTKTYLTHASMLADTTQLASTQGRVTNDAIAANNGYYVWTGTAWTVSLLQPAKQADVDSLMARQTATEAVVIPLDGTLTAKTMVHDDEGRKYALSIGDQVRMLFGVLEKGGVRIKGLLMEAAGLGSKMDGAGRTWMRELADGVAFGPWNFKIGGTGLSIMDGAGRTAFAITHSGKVIAPGIVLNPDNPLFSTKQQADSSFCPLGQRPTDIKQIIVYGQSLGRGVATLIPISTSQPYSNITLAGGVLARPSDAGYNPAAFKPLIEEDSAESPTSAICNGVVRRIVGDGEDHTNWVFMGSSCGDGGKTVEQLSDGGGWLEGAKQVISDSSALASSSGKSYSVWAHVYIQGESQHVAAINEEGRAKHPLRYAGKVLDMHASLTSHIMSTTGQKFQPYLVTYQTGAHRRYGFDTMPIALAQWRTSRQLPNVVMAVPVYIMPHAIDNLHLTNEGSWLMGEYISRAIYWSMYRTSEKWRPLEPVSVLWQDATIDIRFHVPYGSLVIDDALCATTANGGFDVWHGAAVSPIVTSVAVVGADTVRLTLSTPANPDAVLSYGRGRPGDPLEGGPATGPRGNLRDTHGTVDTATSPLGNTFALHNPSVMFEYHRQKGF